VGEAGRECFLLTRDLKLEERVEIFGLHGWCFAFLWFWRMFGCFALEEVTKARHDDGERSEARVLISSQVLLFW